MKIYQLTIDNNNKKKSFLKKENKTCDSFVAIESKWLFARAVFICVDCCCWERLTRKSSVSIYSTKIENIREIFYSEKFRYTIEVVSDRSGFFSSNISFSEKFFFCEISFNQQEKKTYYFFFNSILIDWNIEQMLLLLLFVDTFFWCSYWLRLIVIAISASPVGSVCHLRMTGNAIKLAWLDFFPRIFGRVFHFAIFFYTKKTD